jgi:hypothetical protein
MNRRRTEPRLQRFTGALALSRERIHMSVAQIFTQSRPEFFAA